MYNISGVCYFVQFSGLRNTGLYSSVHNRPIPAVFSCNLFLYLLDFTLTLKACRVQFMQVLTSTDK
jgi:hypothetical protein